VTAPVNAIVTVADEATSGNAKGASGDRTAARCWTWETSAHGARVKRRIVSFRCCPSRVSPMASPRGALSLYFSSLG